MLRVSGSASQYDGTGEKTSRRAPLCGFAAKSKAQMAHAFTSVNNTLYN